MKVGIAGTGVIGGALERWMRGNTGHEVIAYDPPKGRIAGLTGLDVLFVCVPVPTGADRVQDLSIVEKVLGMVDKTTTVFIRSSVTPTTTDWLANVHALKVFAMPEFLTERRADADMFTQAIVCGGAELGVTHYRFVCELFAGKKDVIMMSNVEAELAKYMHNGNGTVKVAFNNLIYSACEKLGARYDLVRSGALMSGHVSKEHTMVPGPDGKRGYGGTCFPKDMEALIGILGELEISCGSLQHMQLENQTVRG